MLGAVVGDVDVHGEPRPVMESEETRAAWRNERGAGWAFGENRSTSRPFRLSNLRPRRRFSGLARLLVPRAVVRGVAHPVKILASVPRRVERFCIVDFGSALLTQDELLGSSFSPASPPRTDTSEQCHRSG